jgi:hypothetical protein
VSPQESAGPSLFLGSDDSLGNRGPLCSLFSFLPGFGLFVDPPTIGIGGVLPIGTALVTELLRTMIVMAFVGVALGGGLAGLIAAQFMSIYGSRARPTCSRAAGLPRADRTARPTSCRPTANRPCLHHRIHKIIRSRAKNGNSGRPCFQRSSPCFLSLFRFGPEGDIQSRPSTPNRAIDNRQISCMEPQEDHTRSNTRQAASSVVE